MISKSLNTSLLKANRGDGVFCCTTNIVDKHMSFETDIDDIQISKDISFGRLIARMGFFVKKQYSLKNEPFAWYLPPM